MGYFANVCRSSNNGPSQGQQVQKLQRKQTTTIKHQPGTKPSVPRSAPIHFISAEGCIGVVDYGTIDDNFDIVAWISSIGITYDPATQQVTYGSTVTAIHNIHQTERSQAFTRISMCPEDTNGKINEHPIEVKCKTDTGSGANVMPILVSRKLCPAMFDSSGKALKKFDADWTTLTVYTGSKIRKFGVRIIKSF